MSPKLQTALELTGYVFAVAGSGALGYVLAGPVLAAALLLLVAAVILIFLGNV